MLSSIRLSNGRELVGHFTTCGNKAYSCIFEFVGRSSVKFDLYRLLFPDLWSFSSPVDKAKAMVVQFRPKVGLVVDKSYKRYRTCC